MLHIAFVQQTNKIYIYICSIHILLFLKKTTTTTREIINYERCLENKEQSKKKLNLCKLLYYSCVLCFSHIYIHACAENSIRKTLKVPFFLYVACNVCSGTCIN